MERLKIHKRRKWVCSGPNENSCLRREETDTFLRQECVSRCYTKLEKGRGKQRENRTDAVGLKLLYART